MLPLLNNPVNFSYLWVLSNFLLFLSAFLIALYLNFNFNTVMVGLTYLLPLVPLGLTPDNAHRFLIVSFQNTVFGLIELVIFVITVRSSDITFDKQHIRQLLGHVLPITLALLGLSFISRSTNVPVSAIELTVIMVLFFAGSALRVLAVYQLGALGFKFDIVFRDQQKLKSSQLYAYVRHPSYTSMMMVILAYAINTHSWLWGVLGMLSAWFGFQYRIHHEEQALREQFGEEYVNYRSRTGMWFPLRFAREKKG